MHADNDLALVRDLRPQIETCERRPICVEKWLDPSIVPTPCTYVLGMQDDC
jgi:hypothetical protein